MTGLSQLLQRLLGSVLILAGLLAIAFGRGWSGRLYSAYEGVDIVETIESIVPYFPFVPFLPLLLIIGGAYLLIRTQNSM